MRVVREAAERFEARMATVTGLRGPWPSAVRLDLEVLRASIAALEAQAGALEAALGRALLDAEDGGDGHERPGERDSPESGGQAGRGVP